MYFSAIPSSSRHEKYCRMSERIFCLFQCSKNIQWVCIPVVCNLWYVYLWYVYLWYIYLCQIFLTNILTYNLLTIASFRIGVPLILFLITSEQFNFLLSCFNHFISEWYEVQCAIIWQIMHFCIPYAYFCIFLFIAHYGVITTSSITFLGSHLCP